MLVNVKTLDLGDHPLLRVLPYTPDRLSTSLNRVPLPLWVPLSVPTVFRPTNPRRAEMSGTFGVC